MIARIATLYEPRKAQRDDLVQEIAFALWQALPRWRGEASLRTFIARIAHNHGTDHLTARGREKLHDELPDTLMDGAPGPERETYLHQLRARLVTALARLPLGQQQAAALALEGFAHAEIAEILDTTVNNVDVRLTRARAALKTALQESP